MHSRLELPASIAFGRFRLLPHRRELLLDERPINLGGRAFDVLIALVEARGAILSKDAIMARVWPGQVVEENNLQVQISALRAAFGNDRDLIRTVFGRGYQFTGDIWALEETRKERLGPAMAGPQAMPALPPTNLPGPISELIGRDDDLREVLGLAGAHRLVTLTGTGGIGKTRLACAAGRQLLPQFPDGVWLAELAPLADADLVPANVAAAVALELASGIVSAERVAEALSGKQLLLVLDNCEHVIEAAARMAEALLHANPAAGVIATSREPLRADGERVYTVLPLAVPPENAETEHDHHAYGAVRLFIERAEAAEPHFAPDQRSMMLIAEICRRLDGIPLAIELAAARGAALGVQELFARFSDLFNVLAGGRRTALPRHQTLRATLDWSYELLAEPERVILRRLAVFVGTFGVEAARMAVATEEIKPSEIVDSLFSLVAQSLVAVDVDRTAARYRLLDTTRAYALEKLDESGERERISRQHAEYYRQLFERAEVEWESRPTAEWLAAYAWRIDNVRTALDWAFSADGDAAIGVALTAAAVPLWMHLSLLDECFKRAQQGLAAVSAGESRDQRCEMKLHAALAASSWWRAAGIYAEGVVSELGAIWKKALEIAETLEDAEYQLRSLWGLYAFHLGIGQFRVALEIAERFRTLAAKQDAQNDQLIGDRMIGCLQHLLGDQASARKHTESMLANFIVPEQRSHHLIRFQFDQRVTARTVFARIIWLLGFPEEAIRAAQGAVDEAYETNHALSLCYALAHAACPTTLWVEDLAAAERYVAMLLDHSTKHMLSSWGALGRTFQGVIAIRRGDVGPGLRQLRGGLAEFRGAISDWVSVMFLSELAAGFAHMGQTADGLAAVEQAIERAERTEARWLFPEALRIKGELLLLRAEAEAVAEAEAYFRRALDWARRQSALSLELRAAMSLARLVRDQGRSDEASVVLQPVFDRFTEGFETANLKSARALLDALQ